MSHKLMIKTHNTTGLKYLCYTQSEGTKYENYKGSGVLWKKHLKKYGEDISTELIFESESYEDFKIEAIAKSHEWDVVESTEWANLKIEEGDGGDTVSNRMWITNDVDNKYIYKTDEIPEGWRRGRKCKFSDPEFQMEMNSRVDIEARGKRIKEAWDDGKFDKRDHSKCGVKGKDNPACRPEVKKKISETAKKTSKERAERIRKTKPWEYRKNAKDN